MRCCRVSRASSRLPLGDASHVITAFAVAYGLSQLFFGPVGDRFGKYIVIAWACLACAVSALLCGFAPTFSWLLACARAGAVPPRRRSSRCRRHGSATWCLTRAATCSRPLSDWTDSWRLGRRARRRIGGRLPELARAVFWDRGNFRRFAALLFRLDRRLPAFARTTHKGTAPRCRERSRISTGSGAPWARMVLATVFLEGALLFGAFAFIASHLHRVHGVSLSVAGSLVMLFGFGDCCSTYRGHAGSSPWRSRIDSLGRRIAGASFS